MSAYYTQWCKEHGEWSMDIDNPGDCPKCIELGLTEIQRLRNEVLDLKTELAGCQKTISFLQAALASPQPGNEQNLYFQNQELKLRAETAERDWLQAHNENIELRKDRHKLREINGTLWAKITAKQRHELNMLWKDNS